MSDQRVVLITGASSGVGQSAARLLAQRGYKVFGSSRNPTAAIGIPGVEMVSLDVRADDSVRACVESVSSRSGQIDVLINNAGYELAGALQELSIEEARTQFETNFFGVVRMINAVLPFMRRQQNGRIINISSLAGLSSIPFMGMYSASKFALEGYTEALRHEVKPFNIHVSMAEPAFLKTPMTEHRQVGAGRMREYDFWRERALRAIRAHEQTGPGLKSSPTRYSKLSPAPLRGCATSLARKRSPSLACGDFFPQECSSREFVEHFHWTRIDNTMTPFRLP